MIRFEQVSKVYRRGKSEVYALRAVDIALAKGSLSFVVGPSGSGKSTLMHLAGGLDRPSSGRIRHGERDLTALDEKELAGFRRHSVGFVFQSFHLLPTLNALENVLLPTVPEGSPRDRVERAHELLAFFGLGDREGHRPTELSGGECQRVSIARALIYDAQTIMADEPTGELDSETGARIVEELRRLSEEEGRTVVVVTHDLSHIRDLDRVYWLKDGRVVKTQGMVEQVLSSDAG